MNESLATDILILGTGGAGLMAALHAFWHDPSLHITLVSKGLLGKSGCTRMVQGGYNVVLDPKDSPLTVSSKWAWTESLGSSTTL